MSQDRLVQCWFARSGEKAEVYQLPETPLALYIVDGRIVAVAPRSIHEIDIRTRQTKRVSEMQAPATDAVIAKDSYVLFFANAIGYISATSGVSWRANHCPASRALIAVDSENLVLGCSPRDIRVIRVSDGRTLTTHRVSARKLSSVVMDERTLYVTADSEMFVLTGEQREEKSRVGLRSAAVGRLLLVDKVIITATESGFVHAMGLRSDSSIPTDEDGYLGLGRCLNSSGASAEAVHVLSHVLGQVNPSSAMVHKELSTAYRKLGRPAQAKRHKSVHQKLSRW